MVLKVLDLASKRATTFLELSYGSGPTFVRYTDADQDTTFETNLYLSRPTMKIKLAVYSGMLKEQHPKITVPADTFLDALSEGQSHAPVTLRIVVSLESDTPGSPVDDVQELFRGLVAVSVRNASGRLNQVTLKCVTWKHESDRPCGFQANPQCFWKFQGRGCIVDSPPGSGSFISAVTPTVPATQAVTVLSIVRDLLTLTADPPGGPFSDLIYHRGFIEFDGLRLGIREWDGFGNVRQFLMERPAPDSWVGQGVSLHQGCDKSLLTCQNRYANDAFFGGMGAGIRDYNPVFEVRD